MFSKPDGRFSIDATQARSIGRPIAKREKLSPEYECASRTLLSDVPNPTFSTNFSKTSSPGITRGYSSPYVVLPSEGLLPVLYLIDGLSAHC